MKRRRWIVQALAALAQNPILGNFFKGKIYQGNSKYVCVPGLNCYSCPAAIGSCPIGSLQAVLADYKYKISFYVLGLIALFGMVAGKWICGWLCPFGWLQDLLHKIPGKKLKIPKKLKWLEHSKYVFLALFVVVFPLLLVNDFGLGDPWYCKYICPSGTVFASFPLMITNTQLRDSIGLLFYWKALLAIAILAAAVFIYRFFCRFFCPLGAIYGLFNKISFLKMYVDSDKCINCHRCEKVCKLDIDTSTTPNNTSCTRCGDCIHECPTKAITKKFTFRS